jgi:hypothetical protein
METCAGSWSAPTGRCALALLFVTASQQLQRVKTDGVPPCKDSFDCGFNVSACSRKPPIHASPFLVPACPSQLSVLALLNPLAG